MTLAEAMVLTAKNRGQRGFTFQAEDGSEVRHTFADLEVLTAERAGAMQAHGLEKGDRLAMVVVEPNEFVITFLAAIRVGVVPVPLYPPMSLGGLDGYRDRTVRILTQCGAKLLVTSPRAKRLLWQLVDQVPTLTNLVTEFIPAEPAYPEITGDDLAFLQYTSGSTDHPKGVMVTHRSLMANIDAMNGPAGVDMKPDHDVMVSWLPLFHDMGLIGFVLGPLAWGTNAVFIPTLRFLKSPRVWMDTIDLHRGTITCAPNFAYAMVTRRLRPAEEAWDLSSLRVVGCGAEPIQAHTLRSFAAEFAPAQLDPTALMPCYGMAESTLAISFSRWDAPMHTRKVNAKQLEAEGRAAEDASGDEHVSCGRAFPGHDIAVFSEDGQACPDGVQGELCVRGPSVTTGYFGDPEATAAAFRDGWLRTGDLGYLVDRQVFVTGRLKDLIILRGRNIHPQAIEWAVADVDGIRRGNVVAFSRPGDHHEEIVVAAEVRGGDISAAIKQQAHVQLGLTVSEVVCLAPGALPKTSSGKLQRGRTRAQYLAGTLGSQGRAPKGGRRTALRHATTSAWAQLKHLVRRRS
jgi:fatty-acyl-CoA synthase